MPLLGKPALLNTILFHITTYAPLARKQWEGAINLLILTAELRESVRAAESKRLGRVYHLDTCPGEMSGSRDCLCLCRRWCSTGQTLLPGWWRNRRESARRRPSKLMLWPS